MVKRVSKKDTRQLLIEATEFVSKPKLSKELKESVKLSQGKADTLVVRNIPCTILNRRNQNGRIYSTEVVQAAINEAKSAMQSKQLLSQACEHPEGSFVSPTTASHVVINSYIKKNVSLEVAGEKGNYDVLFQDWQVLNTQEGKNLRALFEAECSIGTSIRGVGDMNGEYVEDYTLLGCDCVGNPSSSTFTRMPISESVIVESNNLNETFNITTSSTNVMRSLEDASALQKELNHLDFGTVKKTSTKLDSEVDPKTGAETSITTLETETEDEESNLDAALMRAKRAILNGRVSVDSVTIENIKEEEPKESVEEEDDILNEEVPAKRIISLDLSQSAFNKDFYELKAFGDSKYIAELQQIIERKQNENSQEYDPTIARLEINSIDDNTLFIEGLRQEINTLLHILQNTREFKYVWKESVDLKEFSFVLMYGNNSPYELVWNKGTDSVPNGYYSISDGQREILTTGNLSYAKSRLKKLTDNDYTVTKYMREDVKESKDEGRRFVLKAPTGFVSMDGNALVFKDNPEEALHFITGKEESGLVHLSGVQKILDTMGVYDIKKYYQKDTNANTNMLKEIPNAQDQSILIDNPDQSSINQQPSVQEQQQNSITNTKNSNNIDTRYSAKVIEPGMSNNAPVDEIPVSGIKIDSVLSEISNLFKQKTDKLGNGVQIKVTDNYENKTYNYDPKGNKLVPIQNIPQQEAKEGEIVKDDKKLSMEIDDGMTVEKEFDTPEEASVVKAGLENDKIDGSVMMTEDIVDEYFDNIDTPQEKIASLIYMILVKSDFDIEVAKDIIVENSNYINDPLKNGNTALDLLDLTLDNFEDKNLRELREIFIENGAKSSKDLNNEQISIDEKLYRNESDPSDDFVEDSIEESNNEYDITLIDIDYNTNFLLKNLNTEDEMFEVLSNLPDTIGFNYSELIDMPEDFNSIEQIKEYLIWKVNDEVGFPLINGCNIYSPVLNN